MKWKRHAPLAYTTPYDAAVQMRCTEGCEFAFKTRVPMSSIVDMTSEAPKINANLDGKLGNPDLEDEVVRRCADNSELRRPLALKHAARARAEGQAKRDNHEGRSAQVFNGPKLLCTARPSVEIELGKLIFHVLAPTDRRTDRQKGQNRCLRISRFLRFPFFQCG